MGQLLVWPNQPKFWVGHGPRRTLQRPHDACNAQLFTVQRRIKSVDVKAVGCVRSFLSQMSRLSPMLQKLSDINYIVKMSQYIMSIRCW